MGREGGGSLLESVGMGGLLIGLLEGDSGPLVAFPWVSSGVMKSMRRGGEGRRERGKEREKGRN